MNSGKRVNISYSIKETEPKLKRNSSSNSSQKVNSKDQFNSVRSDPGVSPQTSARNLKVQKNIVQKPEVTAQTAQLQSPQPPASQPGNRFNPLRNLEKRVFSKRLNCAKKEQGNKSSYVWNNATSCSDRDILLMAKDNEISKFRFKNEGIQMTSIEPVLVPVTEEKKKSLPIRSNRMRIAPKVFGAILNREVEREMAHPPKNEVHPDVIKGAQNTWQPSTSLFSMEDRARPSPPDRSSASFHESFNSGKFSNLLTNNKVTILKDIFSSSGNNLNYGHRKATNNSLQAGIPVSFGNTI